MRYADNAKDKSLSTRLNSLRHSLNLVGKKRKLKVPVHFVVGMSRSMTVRSIHARVQFRSLDMVICFTYLRTKRKVKREYTHTIA